METTYRCMLEFTVLEDDFAIMQTTLAPHLKVNLKKKIKNGLT